jgi:hypothetical protein
MKIKIQETSKKIEYRDIENGGLNFYGLKIIDIIKYIILYTDD